MPRTHVPTVHPWSSGQQARPASPSQPWGCPGLWTSTCFLCRPPRRLAESQTQVLKARKWQGWGSNPGALESGISAFKHLLSSTPKLGQAWWEGRLSPGSFLDLILFESLRHTGQTSEGRGCPSRSASSGGHSRAESKAGGSEVGAGSATLGAAPHEPPILHCHLNPRPCHPQRPEG